MSEQWVAHINIRLIYLFYVTLNMRKRVLFIKRILREISIFEQLSMTSELLGDLVFTLQLLTL